MYDFSSENVGSLDTKHYDWGWKQGYDCFEHYEGDQDRVKILCVQYWGWKQGKTFQRKNPGELGDENVYENQNKLFSMKTETDLTSRFF